MILKCWPNIDFFFMKSKCLLHDKSYKYPQNRSAMCCSIVVIFQHQKNSFRFFNKKNRKYWKIPKIQQQIAERVLQTLVWFMVQKTSNFYAKQKFNFWSNCRQHLLTKTVLEDTYEYSIFSHFHGMANSKARFRQRINVDQMNAVISKGRPVTDCFEKVPTLFLYGPYGHES